MIPPPTREDLSTTLAELQEIYDAWSPEPPGDGSATVTCLIRLLVDARQERKEIADAFVRMETVANAAVAELKALREKPA